MVNRTIYKTCKSRFLTISYTLRLIFSDLPMMKLIEMKKKMIRVQTIGRVFENGNINFAVQIQNKNLCLYGRNFDKEGKYILYIF